MKDDPCSFDPVIHNYGPEPDPVEVAALIASGLTPQQAYEKAQENVFMSKIRGIYDGLSPFQREHLERLQK